MEPYHAIPGLEHIYLEDSFIVAIDQADGLRFKLEAVITEEHPYYRDPKPGQQYCFRWLTISWLASASIDFQPSGRQPAVDATGSIDYDNIDRFEWADSRFEMEGNFGRVTVEGRPPFVVEHGYVE